MNSGEKQYVTMRELDDKLNSMRWEVRFLIVVAIIANQVLPTADVARAAINAVPFP